MKRLCAHFQRLLRPKADVGDYAHPLTPLEERIVAACRAGSVVDLIGDEEVTRVGMEGWGQERAISAKWLAQLVSGRLERSGLHHKGVRLRGLVITGPLDWTDDSFLVPLSLEDCRFTHQDLGHPSGTQEDGRLLMSRLSAVRIELKGCLLPGLLADALHLTNDLVLVGSCLTGPLNLVGAEVGGSILGERLEIRDQATSPHEQGLRAENLTVKGDIELQGCYIHGTVD
jgi:hypothetical protein